MNEISLIFGTRCNLECKYCFHQIITHKMQTDYYFDLNVINNLARIMGENHGKMLTYFGGEPLIYWDKIKICIPIFAKYGIPQRIISNSYYLNDEIVEWVNKYNMTFICSHDGKETVKYRGVDVLKNKAIKTRLSKINKLKFGAVITSGNENVFNIYRSIKRNFLNKNIEIFFTPPQVYEENKFIVDKFDFNAFIKGYIDYLHYTGNKYIRPYRQKVGISVMCDGIVRNLYTNSKIGEVLKDKLYIPRDGVNKEETYGNCDLEKCPYFNNGCMYKTLQIEDNKFCKQINHCYKTIERIENNG